MRFLPWILFACVAVAHASEEAPMTDRRIEKRVLVAAPVEAVWSAWTTAEGLEFISAKSNVELRADGPYEWFVDLEPDARGKRGGEGARILAFVPEDVLVFTWNFPPSIPSLRDADANTICIVQFDAVDDMLTGIRFTQMGWREGEDWDAGYAYFDRAWDVVLQRCAEHFAGDPGSDAPEDTPEDAPGDDGR